MSIYVDPPFTMEAEGAQAHRVGARHGHRWCHLIADTEEELHAFAARIGMKRAWFQPRSFPHYDLVPTRRAHAVRLGAVELDRRAFVEKMREIRARHVRTEVAP